MPTKRFVVTGRVQGVGYRVFAAMAASGNGIRGFVRNLSDGSVEVVASGESAGLRAFHAELETGPGMARVDGIQEEDHDVDEAWKEFRII